LKLFQDLPGYVLEVQQEELVPLEKETRLCNEIYRRTAKNPVLKKILYFQIKVNAAQNFYCTPTFNFYILLLEMAIKTQ